MLLHGFGGDLHTWDALWPAIGASLPALRYDQRGCGGSSAPSGPYDHADDLRAILDTEGIAQCDLVGVSQGGAIALHFALDQPARVRRLVLLSPAIVGWDWSADWRALSQPIKAAARAGRMDEARRLWWEHPLFRSTRASPAGPALRAEIERYSGRHWVRDEHRALLPDVERLHQLAAPTLLLTGARDLEDFRVIAALLEGAVPRLRRVDAPGLGHLLHLEDPAGTARRISEFLA